MEQKPKKDGNRASHRIAFLATSSKLPTVLCLHNGFLFSVLYKPLRTDALMDWRGFKKINHLEFFCWFFPNSWELLTAPCSGPRSHKRVRTFTAPLCVTMCGHTVSTLIWYDLFLFHVVRGKQLSTLTLTVILYAVRHRKGKGQCETYIQTAHEKMKIA